MHIIVASYECFFFSNCLNDQITHSWKITYYLLTKNKLPTNRLEELIKEITEMNEL